MPKILVIEDQPQMRKNIVTILQMENYEVISAENGRQGLELARSEKPAVILCDVMMPEMNGHQVLQELRATPETVTLPFIFLTAKGDKMDLRAGMNLGADDYLTKPVSREELLEALQARLTHHAAHAATAKAAPGFNPNFNSPAPLQALGLTEREAEVLLWVTQGKSNGDVAILLGMAEKTVKKHMGNIFEKLGVEGRNAASLRALEILSGGK